VIDSWLTRTAPDAGATFTDLELADSVNAWWRQSLRSEPTDVTTADGVAGRARAIHWSAVVLCKQRLAFWLPCWLQPFSHSTSYTIW